MRRRLPWWSLGKRHDRRMLAPSIARLPAWVTLGSLVLLLAILAWYQFRWTGAVSRAERASLRSALITTLESYAHDFDRELTRLALAFADSESGGGDAELARSLVAAHERWVRSAADPRLLDDIWLARTEERDGLTLYRLDLDAEALTPAAWPEALIPAQQHVQSFGRLVMHRFGGSSRSGEAIRMAVPLAPEVPALILPVYALEPVAGESGLEARHAQRATLRSFLILGLDMAHLRESHLPALARQYNLGGEGSAYEIVILDEAGNQVYRSGTEELVAQHPADGEARLFGLLSAREVEAIREELGMVRQRHRLGGGGEAARRGFARVMLHSDGPGSRQPGWRILAFHRLGSLDAVVAQARTRNLLVVVVSLALLAASVGFLVASNRRARRLAMQQMDFVATMSHELRTPLAAIRSLAENLEHGLVPDEDRARSYGAMIVRQERKLERLVEEVLELSGMGLAPASRSLETVDARAVVTDAIEATRSNFDEADATLQTKLPAAACPIRADAEALSRALQNLLANAVKFGGPKPEVAIRLERADDDQEVRIVVSDHGPGIAGEDLPHIFEPFYRAAAARDAGHPGNGLGLSLVERIVTAHEGRVDVDSQPGQGATFTVRVPGATP